MEEEKIAHAGSFCWNEACADDGQGGKGNLIKNGKIDTGVQRYRCQTCTQTFTQTKGTLLYRCRHSEEERVACLAIGGDRTSLAAIHRMKGIKEETVCRWMERAATQVEQIKEHLVGPKKLSRVQLDALWTDVGPKGEQGGSQKKKHAGRFGAAPPSTWTPV
jgi:transposase-like protein